MTLQDALKRLAAAKRDAANERAIRVELGRACLEYKAERDEAAQAQAATKEALHSLYDTMVFDPRGWANSGKGNAWIYGLVVGWDDDAMAEVAAKFRWDDATVARLRRLHAALNAEPPDAS